MSEERKTYYIGLDIGTNSVGWAVTDEEYNLCKFKHKDMWGIRLFDAAETAADRRLKRSGRRRLARRKGRIDLLQQIFAEEISKIDPTFFIRLNESRKHLDDKSTGFKHVLFNDDSYNDIAYYNEYPTIYHLRKELIDNKEPHDPRLVYLALHHIIKYRGHFLIEGNLNDAGDFTKLLMILIDVINDTAGIKCFVDNTDEFEKVLGSKDMAKSVKQKTLARLFVLDEEEKSKDEIKKEKSAINEILKFIVGNKGDLSKIFDGLDDMENKSFTMSGDVFDTVRDELESIYIDGVQLLDAMKSLHDWNILSDIMEGNEYISYAKVNQYEKHKENLYLLRGLLMKYADKKVYNDFFNNHKGTDNYSNYIGYVKKNGKTYTAAACSDEAFYKKLVKILKGITVDEADKEVYNALLEEAELWTLLPVQRTKDNGVIPKQVHEQELNKILENASGYLDFLTYEEDGISNADKIKSIFNFRIPYYVGPLSDRHKEQGSNSWIVRKEEGYIYPWNFNDKVDLKASNKKFIERMTNKCTYLIGADVLPKNSLLYSRYMVLNELNNLKIRGHNIDVKLKQDIYNNLFRKYDKVTGKRLLNYLRSEDSELSIEDLSGFDIDFKASLKVYNSFEKIFGNRMSDVKIQEMVEDIIRWGTIYGDDKNTLAEVIYSEYPGEISKEQMKLIKRMNFSGWGNFSKEFLTSIEDINKETGEYVNIMQALWETNNNLNQLLSKEFSYKEQIDKYNQEKIGEIKEISYDSLVKDLYVSPANKRAIWQTLQIVEEIKGIMGYDPAKIFVEMARGGDQEKERTVSRKNQLLACYASCDEDMSEWIEEIENTDESEFNSLKLYLYYKQMGRCMYTGERIDLDELMTKNSKWDKDHIFPQSKIKDDSIDNLVLVKKTDNAKKDNELLSADIQNKMQGFWKMLLKNNFISKKKYDRLMRREDFTDSELAGFISRQLVETRQSSKAVAELLNTVYKDSKIVYVKAGLVSQFRHNELKMCKSRIVNDFHHAKDAYLNVVVGNVYDTKFTSNPVKWMRDNKNTNYSINRVFWYDVALNGKTVWAAPDITPDKKLITNEDGGATGGTIDTVRAVMEKNNILYTEYTYCKTGQLFNDTIYPKSDKERIPIKAGLDPSKYGGYTSATPSKFTYVECDYKNKRVRKLVGIPIYVANMQEHNENAIAEYLKDKKGYSNVKILIETVKMNSLVVVDGFPMRLRGFDGRDNFEMKPNVQLILDKDNAEVARKVEKYYTKGANRSIIEKFDGLSDEKLLDLYDVLLDKLKNSIYSKRPSNEINLVENSRGSFKDLNVTEKAKVIYNLLGLFSCAKATTNLTGLSYFDSERGKMVSGTSSSGRIRRGISNKRIKIINQSITGLRQNETVIEL